MKNLAVEIDGVTLPLVDCFWVRVNSAGCAVGSVRPDLGDDLIATPQQAQREWSSTKRQQAKDEKHGMQHLLLSPKQWAEQAKPCFLGHCDHPSTVR
ncbi:hypothetical protein ABZ438_07725 [Streptomyces sp. NPDC005786]|uniref:hypothetical protein n=1 Tax=Streptomyces sp. NPDC005786 TaxID=3154891 RepID=UPI0033DF4734